EVTVQAMAFLVQVVPIGTNIGLVRMLWVMVNGSFLQSRGALFSALHLSSFTVREMRRSWAALRYGVWEINELLEQWQMYVESENQWRVRPYEGYQVVSVDITGFWRPRLQGWLGKHYHHLAQKALPAVVVGVIIISGQVGSHRIPLLRRIVRCQAQSSKPEFRCQLLREAAAQAALDRVIVVDAEFSIAELQAADVPRYVVRLASNATARRNQLPAYKGRGRYPQYGETVRPLPRKRQAHQIPATTPDQQSHFDYQGRRIQISFWHGLVSVDTPAAAANLQHTFAIYVYADPRYKQPLVLATNLCLLPETAYLIYRDRWPVEQAPLAAKQMIGLHRHFVFAPETCFRLPELGLLAGAILTYVAAVLPPIPSGFWDRSPQATPGRLRRVLAQADFPNLAAFDPELRKKNAVTAHLPKGIDAHRRTKRAA
ncbi:MAG: hypothetical protein ACREQV_11250, partial [Candidatus Binatia bacterium]